MTLVTPLAIPVGGRWQRWVDETKVSTVTGKLVLVASKSTEQARCGTDAAACSGLDETPIAVYANPSQLTRGVLYHELGHVFDEEDLTDTDRTRFMAIWRWNVLPVQTVSEAWWSNEDRASSLFGKGPPGEWFGEGYRLCATYGAWTWKTAFAEDWYQYGYPAQFAWGVNGRSAKWAWTIRAQQETCRLINAVALRVSEAPSV